MNGMNEETGTPQPSARSGCGTMMIWILPSFVIPFLLLFSAREIEVGVFISLVVLIILGITWSRRVGRISEPTAGRRAGLVVLYVVVQAVWIPLFAVAALWAACLITGAPKL